MQLKREYGVPGRWKMQNGKRNLPGNHISRRKDIRPEDLYWHIRRQLETKILQPQVLILEPRSEKSNRIVEAFLEAERRQPHPTR